LGQYLDDVVSPALAAVVVVGATCLFRWGKGFVYSSESAPWLEQTRWSVTRGRRSADRGTGAPHRYGAVQQTYSLLSAAGGHKFSVSCACAVSNQSWVSEQRDVTSFQQLFYVIVSTPLMYTECKLRQTWKLNW
jgi:hypothetical protein